MGYILIFSPIYSIDCMLHTYVVVTSVVCVMRERVCVCIKP